MRFAVNELGPYRRAMICLLSGSSVAVVGVLATLVIEVAGGHGNAVLGLLVLVGGLVAVSGVARAAWVMQRAARQPLAADGEPRV